MADGWGNDGLIAGLRTGDAAHEADLYDAAYLEWLRFGAENDLLEANPEASCKTGVTAAQMTLVKQVAAVLGVGVLLAPMGLFSAVSALAFCAFCLLIIYRCVLLCAGFAARTASPLSGDSAKRRFIWPRYSVLVPVFREPEAIGPLIAALKGLDYPKRQLEILILLEESDTETLAAIEQLKLRPYFKVLVVPEGEVQTKPRALNFGLKLATGQMIAVYDAEDAMHSTQLKDAVRAFQYAREETGRKPLACVQAPLIPHNSGESWIAAQFTREYRVHFGLIVPGLSALRLPVMLGGTSNHFDRAALETVGGWDPYNVTEDADLGLRFAAAGYRVGHISPPTFEEAPIGLRQWIGQRSRWVKGFIQTAGVFFRASPASRIRVMGRKNYVSAVLLLSGSVLSAVFHGPFALWLVAQAVLPGLTPPSEAIILCLTGFSVHILSVVMSGALASAGAIRALITAPLYWPLQTVAAGKAIYELIVRPFYWDKTQHGVSVKSLSRKQLRTAKV